MNFNNNMKQVLHILLTLLLLFTFSCNDDNVNNDNNSILIGSWGEQFPADEFFELTFYNDDTGVMTVYYNEGKKKSPDPFTYSFDKNTMKLIVIYFQLPLHLQTEIVQVHILMSGRTVSDVDLYSLTFISHPSSFAIQFPCHFVFVRRDRHGTGY